MCKNSQGWVEILFTSFEPYISLLILNTGPMRIKTIFFLSYLKKSGQQKYKFTSYVGLRCPVIRNIRLHAWETWTSFILLFITFCVFALFTLQSLVVNISSVYYFSSYNILSGELSYGRSNKKFNNDGYLLTVLVLNITFLII